MAEFESTTNEDCQKCCLSRYFDDGGGDYEDMIYYCNKCNKNVTFTRVEDKPCGLSKGKYYTAKIRAKK